MFPPALDHDDFFGKVLASFPDGSVNVFDRELRYLYAGGRGLGATGLSSSMLTGKRLADLFTPESVQYVEPFYRRAFAGESVRFDLPVFNRVFGMSAAPFDHDGDEVTSIIVVAQDITEAKRTESALAESEARLQLALDVASVSTWDLDVASGSIHPSESVDQLLGTPAGSPPRTLEALVARVHPDDREQVVSGIMSTIASGAYHSAEFRVLRTDGTTRWVLSRAEPFRNDEGHVTRLLGAMIDVTAQHEAGERLRESSRRKDDLLAVLGHELRQPVQAAMAALGVMQARIGRETGERARVTLERQVGHISRLVDDLLDVGRILRGEVVLNTRAIDLSNSVQLALETVAASKPHRHDVIFEPPHEPALVRADPDRLQQVLVNLIGNALKYTPPGGRIEMQVDNDGASVVFRIADSGAGIDPGDLPHVFDLFTRGDQDGRGLGVGLAVVRRIVEQHGGDVTAESAGRGQGAVFVMRLPKA